MLRIELQALYWLNWKKMHFYLPMLLQKRRLYCKLSKTFVRMNLIKLFCLDSLKFSKINMFLCYCCLYWILFRSFGENTWSQECRRWDVPVSDSSGTMEGFRRHYHHTQTCVTWLVIWLSKPTHIKSKLYKRKYEIWFFKCPLIISKKCNIR